MENFRQHFLAGTGRTHDEHANIDIGHTLCERQKVATNRVCKDKCLRALALLRLNMNHIQNRSPLNRIVTGVRHNTERTVVHRLNTQRQIITSNPGNNLKTATHASNAHLNLFQHCGVAGEVEYGNLCIQEMFVFKVCEIDLRYADAPLRKGSEILRGQLVYSVNPEQFYCMMLCHVISPVLKINAA